MLIPLLSSALTPTTLVARAEVYSTEETAVSLIFKNLKMNRREIELTDDQAKAIEKSSGETVRNRKIVVFVAPTKEAVFIDKVIGKHELITYATGLRPDGSVQSIEIIEYKETYGSQVKNDEWRKQFVGKNTASKIKVGSDIKNISGATLSSAHVSAGVKRLVHTYAILKSIL